MGQSFKLSTFSFETNSPTNILEHIKTQSFFENDTVKNVIRFFEETRAQYSKQLLLASSKKFASFEKISSKACWDDLGTWYCHTSNPYFSLQEPEHDVYLGFAHQRDRQTNKYNYAFLHSFVISKSGILRDPHIEAHLDQSEYWVKKSALDELRYALGDFSYYFGTKIPKIVVESIFNDRPPNYPKHLNVCLWWYLRNDIFNDIKKTDWFIEIVNNNGAGWRWI